MSLKSPFKTDRKHKSSDSACESLSSLFARLYYGFLPLSRLDLLIEILFSSFSKCNFILLLYACTLPHFEGTLCVSPKHRTYYSLSPAADKCIYCRHSVYTYLFLLIYRLEGCSVFCSMQQATVLSIKGKKIIHILKFHLKARKLQLEFRSHVVSPLHCTGLLWTCIFIRYWLYLHASSCNKLNIMKKVKIKIFTWIQWYNDLA